MIRRSLITLALLAAAAAPAAAQPESSAPDGDRPPRPRMRADLPPQSTDDGPRMERRERAGGPPPMLREQRRLRAEGGPGPRDGMGEGERAPRDRAQVREHRRQRMMDLRRERLHQFRAELRRDMHDRMHGRADGRPGHGPEHRRGEFRRPARPQPPHAPHAFRGGERRPGPGAHAGPPQRDHAGACPHCGGANKDNAGPRHDGPPMAQSGPRAEFRRPQPRGESRGESRGEFRGGFRGEFRPAPRFQGPPRPHMDGRPFERRPMREMRID